MAPFRILSCGLPYKRNCLIIKIDEPCLKDKLYPCKDLCNKSLPNALENSLKLIKTIKAVDARHDIHGLDFA
jgi:hypothetical protein